MKVVVLILLGLVVLAGCASPTVTPVGKLQMGEDLGPLDVTWVSPGKVQIGNIGPGDRAEQLLQIHNGEAQEATFLVYYKEPSRERDGYLKAPEGYSRYVHIGRSELPIAGKETVDVLVALEFPEGYASMCKKWEFWVAARLAGGGPVQSELATRWMVTER